MATNYRMNTFMLQCRLMLAMASEAWIPVFCSTPKHYIFDLCPTVRVFVRLWIHHDFNCPHRGLRASVGLCITCMWVTHEILSFSHQRKKTQQNLFHICLTQMILLRVVDYIHMCTRLDVGCADKCLWTSVSLCGVLGTGSWSGHCGTQRHLFYFFYTSGRVKHLTPHQKQDEEIGWTTRIG